MYTLLKPLKVREELLRRGVKVFTPHLFAHIFGLNPVTTKHFLENQTIQGFLLRLKRGVYTLKSDPPSEEEVANTLYQPSYISFEYALAYYGILPEMSYVVTSATTKATRLFTTGTTSFSYRTIKPEAYTGYSLIKKDNRSFSIAELEKALVDYLYFVSLRKQDLNDRLISQAKQQIDKAKLKHYAALFQSQQLDKFIEKVL